MVLQFDISFDMLNQLKKRITNLVYFIIIKDVLIDKSQGHSCVCLFGLGLLDDCHAHVGLLRVIEVEKIMEGHIVVGREINRQINRCLNALFYLLYQKILLNASQIFIDLCLA